MEANNDLGQWVLDPFEEFYKHREEASELLHLTMEGLRFLRGRPAINRTLNELSGAEQPLVEERDLKLAEHNASLAEQQVASDYPLLHQQAVMSMWAALENLMLGFFTSWLENVPKSRSIETLQRTRVKLGELEGLEGRGRWSYVLDRLEDTLGTRRLSGVKRFETLFNDFGLSSSLEQSISATLYELHQVRNVFAHRRGVADSYFVEKFPGLGYSIGDPVVVSHEDYHRYYDAVDLYVFEVQQRVAAYAGLPKLKHKPGCRFHVDGQECGA